MTDVQVREEAFFENKSKELEEKSRNFSMTMQSCRDKTLNFWNGVRS